MATLQETQLKVLRLQLAEQEKKVNELQGKFDNGDQKKVRKAFDQLFISGKNDRVIAESLRSVIEKTPESWPNFLKEVSAMGVSLSLESPSHSSRSYRPERIQMTYAEMETMSHEMQARHDRGEIELELVEG